MIRQVLADALGFVVEHPWWLAAAFVVWMAASVGLAVWLGPAMGRAEHERHLRVVR